MSKTFALWLVIAMQTIGIIACFVLAFTRHQLTPVFYGVLLMPLDYFMYFHILPSTREYDRRDKEFRKWMKDQGYSK